MSYFLLTYSICSINKCTHVQNVFFFPSTSLWHPVSVEISSFIKIRQLLLIRKSLFPNQQAAPPFDYMFIQYFVLLLFVSCMFHYNQYHTSKYDLLVMIFRLFFFVFRTITQKQLKEITDFVSTSFTAQHMDQISQLGFCLRISPLTYRIRTANQEYLPRYVSDVLLRRKRLFLTVGQYLTKPE